MSKNKKKTRYSSNFRKTNETEISVEVNIDGNGIYDIKTPLPFLRIGNSSVLKINIFLFSLIDAM